VLHLKIDNEGLLRTKFYDKKDEFKFPNVNFLFVCSNIPAALAYCVYLTNSVENLTEIVFFYTCRLPVHIDLYITCIYYFNLLPLIKDIFVIN
jgi:hypothetical protein